MADGFYKALYEHAKFSWEAEEKRETRKITEKGLVLSVAAGVLGIGFFAFGPKVLPELQDTLVQVWQVNVVRVLLCAGAAGVVSSILLLVDFDLVAFLEERGLGIEEEYVDGAEDADETDADEGILDAIYQLHIDATELEPEGLPDPESETEYAYALLFGETVLAASQYRRENDRRHDRLTRAQVRLVVGLVLMLAGVSCYALMQG